MQSYRRRWLCRRVQSLELDDFEVDDFEVDDFEVDVEAVVEAELESDGELDELSDVVFDEEDEPDSDTGSDPDELLSPDEEVSDLFDSEELLPFSEDFERLSVLKKPEPLKLTPTGWKTFLTGITSPEAGCANSDSVSSLNDC